MTWFDSFERCVAQYTELLRPAILALVLLTARSSADVSPFWTVSFNGKPVAFADAGAQQIQAPTLSAERTTLVTMDGGGHHVGFYARALDDFWFQHWAYFVDRDDGTTPSVCFRPAMLNCVGGRYGSTQDVGP